MVPSAPIRSHPSIRRPTRRRDPCSRACGHRCMHRCGSPCARPAALPALRGRVKDREAPRVASTVRTCGGARRGSAGYGYGIVLRQGAAEPVQRHLLGATGMYCRAGNRPRDGHFCAARKAPGPASQ